jgi:hypothetical protein
MDDGKRRKIHHITTQGTTTLKVVYTNEEATVERILAMYEKFLEKEKHMFVGLELELSQSSRYKRREMVVMQIVMR